MRLEGLGGNEFTWNALITAEKWLRVWSCVIDMLCRSWKIEEAYDLVYELGTEAKDFIVGSFLNGCVAYNRPDLAKKITEDVMKMKTNRPGGFVTLSNVYAGEGEWEKLRC
ncbi:pentatricopeptide repeat-containing protein [Tanacetum coccineum]